MKINIPKNYDFTEIERRLKELTLAFTPEVGHFDDIHVVEGKTKIVGTTAVHAYLDQLAGEQHQWFYCNC